MSGASTPVSRSAAIVALAVGALLCAPAHASANEKVDEIDDVGKIDQTEPAVDDAAGERRDPRHACDEVLTSASALGERARDGELSPRDANALHGAIGRALRADAGGAAGASAGARGEAAAAATDARARAGGEACAPRVRRWLESQPCTAAYGVVASGAFGADSWPAAFTAAVVGRALDRAARGELGCAKVVLPSVQSASRVDAELIAVLRRARGAPDAGVVDASWLVLGTMELRAREAEQPDLARVVDDEIAAELARRAPGDRGALLEAAGNGGCTGCAPDVARATLSADPLTRRAAVGALRFVGEPRAASALCVSLRSDDDARVRAHAAWSLGWSDVAAETRIACLREAARLDRSADVRADAAQALASLAPGTRELGL